MKVLPDFTTEPADNSIRPRVSQALSDLCAGCMPLEGPTGLRAVAQEECRSWGAQARGRFERSEAFQKRARIKSRMDVNRDAQATAQRRKAQAEAALNASLTGDDEGRIVAARMELSGATSDISTRREESTLLDRLWNDLERECEALRVSIESEEREKLLQLMRLRAGSACNKLTALFQGHDVADALSEYALSMYVLNLPTIYGSQLSLEDAAGAKPSGPGDCDVSSG